MCPACLTTLTLAVGAACSTGGVAALMLRRLYVARGQSKPAPVTPPKED